MIPNGAHEHRPEKFVQIHSGHYHVPPPRRPKPDVWGRLWAAVALAGIIAFMVWVAQMPDPKPMPCKANEVYAWTDYPTDAGCKRAP